MTSQDPEGSFRTHANYLRALATLAGYRTWPPRQPAKVLEDQRSTILAAPSLSDTPQGSPDRGGVRRSLSNAWGTELLLTLSAEYASEDELARLANNWGSVQAYYVGYHAFQAYLLANGESRPKSHPMTQTMFADRWAGRALDLSPWSFAAGDGVFYNGPSGRSVDLGVHAWTACDETNCWDIGGAALKSTRDDTLREAMKKKREAKKAAARKEWNRVERERLDAGRRPRKTPSFTLPYLSAEEKADIRSKTRRHTALDYLYRLRIKSNYEDSTMFTDGPTDENASRGVHLDLVRLASSVLFLHELHVRERLGLTAMTKIVDDWIGKNMPPNMTLGVAARRDLLVAP
jgi:hypothetical protein